MKEEVPGHFNGAGRTKFSWDGPDRLDFPSEQGEGLERPFLGVSWRLTFPFFSVVTKSSMENLDHIYGLTTACTRTQPALTV